MADAGNILNDDNFFGDTVDTPKGILQQYRKQECLKSVIEGQGAFIGYKWTQENVDKASDKIINKAYTEYKQRELNEKGEKSRKALGKHAIKLQFNGISRVIRIRDVKKLQQDIDNDPFIKDQMVSLGCLLVCTFGNYLASVLVAVYKMNSLGSGDEQDYENEGHESD